MPLKRINVYIPEEDYNWLNARSEETGRPVAEIVRRSLTTWIKMKETERFFQATADDPDSLENYRPLADWKDESDDEEEEASPIELKYVQAFLNSMKPIVHFLEGTGISVEAIEIMDKRLTTMIEAEEGIPPKGKEGTGKPRKSQKNSEKSRRKK